MSEAFGAIAGTITLVCECGDSSCVEQLAMPPEEYGAVRDDPLLFIVKPGHETADVEDVVDRRGEYDIVRKHAGSPAVLARMTKPID